MKKTLERLRQRKEKAVNRMAELNALAKQETRDLTPAEKLEFTGAETLAADLAGDIAELEREIAAQTPPVVAPPTPTPVVVPPTNQPDNTAALAGAATEERSRVIGIRERLKSSRLPADILASLETELVGTAEKPGATLEAASTRIFTEMAKHSAAQPETRSHVVVLSDEDVKVRGTVTSALLHRFNPTAFKDQADPGRQWVGLSLMDLGRECLRRKGINPLGRGPAEVAQLALTTSDFPNILADVANKTLRMGYENYPNTFQVFCRKSTANDFKSINRTQLSGAPAMLQVNENGEIKQGYLTDGKETYYLLSYGRILNITRKTIINDDLGAFTRVPELMGRKAATLEGDIVWALITANGNMADGNAVFSTQHANYTGTGTAISADSVGVGAAMMTVQTGLEGDVLNIRPEYLAAPVGKQLIVERLLLTPNYPDAQSNVVPESVRKLKPIIEPRLDASSSTKWYMFAGPGQVDTIEYSYLAGQEGMRFETEMGFEVDGVRMKAAHDFGAGVIDYRGMYENAGA
jgi:hypothetical protein